ARRRTLAALEAANSTEQPARIVHPTPRAERTFNMPQTLLRPNPRAPEPPSGPSEARERPETPRLSGLELLAHADDLATRAAAAGALESIPAHSDARQRDLFGGRNSGDLVDRVQQIASRPTRDSLEAAHHLQAAGTMHHDRAVARRAEEEFNPTRTIPDL